MAKPGYDEHRYEVITQDGGNGDVIVPIPPELLRRMNWQEGDELDLEFTKDGRVVISRRK